MIRGLIRDKLDKSAMPHVIVKLWPGKSEKQLRRRVGFGRVRRNQRKGLKGQLYGPRDVRFEEAYPKHRRLLIAALTTKSLRKYR